jgi:hypothetical protein
VYDASNGGVQAGTAVSGDVLCPGPRKCPQTCTPLGGFSWCPFPLSDRGGLLLGCVCEPIAGAGVDAAQQSRLLLQGVVLHCSLAAATTAAAWCFQAQQLMGAEWGLCSCSDDLRLGSCAGMS